MAAGLIPIGAFEAAGDLTTAANIRDPRSESQRAVDERVGEQVVPLVAAAIADDDTVALAAAAAVTTDLAGRRVVEATEAPLTAELSWRVLTDDYFAFAFRETFQGGPQIQVPRGVDVPVLVGGVIDSSLLPPPPPPTVVPLVIGDADPSTSFPAGVRFLWVRPGDGLIRLMEGEG